MTEIDYAQLQRQYGGRYVAHRRGEIIAAAETYDQLSDQLEQMALNWDDVLIEYIEPANIVCVY